MRKVLILAALAALALASGCGGGKTAPPSQYTNPSSSPQTMNWAFAPKALEFTFISDPFLNEYEGAAHTLSVCVYQLQAPTAFQQLAATAPGISKLLECTSFDQSVVSAQRVIVQPGRNEVLTVDRNEKAKFVAIACGYYDLNLGAATRVYEIPVSSDTSGWLWWKETTYQPGKLSKKILLGKTGVQTMGDGS
ncbi:MAG: type VI secretion system lipoprotein TssJ [Acidobacteriota bacterium]